MDFWDSQLRKNRRPWPLFLTDYWRGVAISLLSLFSAIFIYKTAGQFLGERGGLLTVPLFFFGLYLFKLISNLWAENLAQKIGLKKQIYFGQGFLVLALVSLFLAKSWPLLILPASIFWGLAAGFYWFGWHGLMAKVGQMGFFGRQLGTFGAISGIFSLWVPFLGGLVITKLGYPVLFLVSLFFVVLSLLTLGKLEEEKTHADTTLAEIFTLFKTHFRMFLAYFGEAAASTLSGVALPLYLFLILKKELSLGEFFTLVAILAAGASFLIGRWVDLKGKKAPITLGSLIFFFIYLGRGVIINIPGLLILSVIANLSGSLRGIPMGVWTYEKAINGHSTGRAVLFREVAIGLGEICGCLLLLAVIWVKLGLNFAFFLAAGFSLLPLLIAHETKDKQ